MKPKLILPQSQLTVIFGRLTTEDYSDETAADPRIDELRAKVSPPRLSTLWDFADFAFRYRFNVLKTSNTLLTTTTPTSASSVTL